MQKRQSSIRYWQQSTKYDIILPINNHNEDVKFMDNIACYHHPSVTLLVDDQHSFLSKIEVNLQEVTMVKSYDDPINALDTINHHAPPPYNLSDIISNQVLFDGGYSKPDQPSLSINLGMILDRLYDPKRFMEITDILVDYNMPDMNGIDLCEKIHNKLIRRLMITGDADANVAIRAFNSGAINKFIMKQSDHFTQEVINAINLEKEKYFIENSYTIMDYLANDQYNCLQHPKFTELFKQLQHQHQIVEYYLIDDSGSYLMLDKHGKPTWFIVRGEQALDDNFVFAEDSRAPQGILDVLQNREKLLFLFSEDDQRLPAIKWLPYLHDAHAIPGIDGFYYSVIRDENQYDSQLRDIVSYEMFTREQQIAA